jgi:nucleotide-binding universal stress UspA family protein
MMKACGDRAAGTRTGCAMNRNIYLAYDGSIHGDWIARYAVQFATGTGRLVLLHVPDGPAPTPAIQRKIDAIQEDCTRHGISLECRFPALHGNIVTTLLAAIPRGTDSLCLCGARIAARGKGFLAGTVAEKLLRGGKCNVMSLRVVIPGHLGQPRTLLFPVAGRAATPRSVFQILPLLQQTVRHVHVLRILPVSHWWSRYLRHKVLLARRASGSAHVAEALEDLASNSGHQEWHVDGHVVLSDDWAREITVQASRLHAGLIVLGATERSLSFRLLHGNRIEEVLRRAPCDVAIYRSL